MVRVEGVPRGDWISELGRVIRKCHSGAICGPPLRAATAMNATWVLAMKHCWPACAETNRLSSWANGVLLLCLTLLARCKAAESGALFRLFGRRLTPIFPCLRPLHKDISLAVESLRGSHLSVILTFRAGDGTVVKIGILATGKLRHINRLGSPVCI